MGDRILIITKHIRSKKGQGVLETAVAFLIIVLLIGGIAKIWLWANNQIVQRQLRYNATRRQAGIGSDTYQWVDWNYTPPALTEEDVLPKVDDSE